MTIFDSRLPEKGHSTLGKKQVPDYLSLNNVFQESLRKAQGVVDKVKLIVRSETLPLVKGDYEEMVKLFDDLLAMILNHSANNTRLFLYINCEEDTSDIIDMTIEEGIKHYFIKFHTNISTHNDWKVVNSETLLNCRQLLSRYNGNLAVNDVSSTGCLFSVSLPGKIE